jgi:xylose isomerase
LIEDGRLDAIKTERYAGWDGPLGAKIGGLDLAGIADLAVNEAFDPTPRSGRQERIENLINRFI